MVKPHHNDNNGRQKSPTKRFLSVLGLFMFALYFALGVMIIFWDGFLPGLSGTLRMLFGVLLVIYAFFRFVRLLQNR